MYAEGEAWGHDFTSDHSLEPYEDDGYSEEEGKAMIAAGGASSRVEKHKGDDSRLAQATGSGNDSECACE